MKKTFTLLLLMLLTIVAHRTVAQIELGSVNLRLGAQINAAATFTKSTYTIANSTTSTNRDTSAVVAIKYPIGVDVGVLKFMTAGVYLRPGTWLDEDDTDDDVRVIDKSIAELALSFKFYAVNKPKFNLYIGTDFGISRFEKETERSLGIFKEEIYQSWGGSVANVNLGFNAYFGEKFGMYYQMGYVSHNFNLNEYTYNAGNVIADGFSANLLAKGLSLELGLCYKLGNK